MPPAPRSPALSAHFTECSVEWNERFVIRTTLAWQKPENWTLPLRKFLPKYWQMLAVCQGLANFKRFFPSCIEAEFSRKYSGQQNCRRSTRIGDVPEIGVATHKNTTLESSETCFCTSPLIFKTYFSILNYFFHPRTQRRYFQ